MDNIEVLSEGLGSLQIMEEALNKYKQTDIDVMIQDSKG